MVYVLQNSRQKIAIDTSYKIVDMIFKVVVLIYKISIGTPYKYSKTCSESTCSDIPVTAWYRLTRYSAKLQHNHQRTKYFHCLCVKNSYIQSIHQKSCSNSEIKFPT